VLVVSRLTVASSNSRRIHYWWIKLWIGFAILTIKKAILEAGMTVHDVGVLLTGGLTVDYAKIVTDGREVQEGGAGFYS
jgi:hypothetical protein